MAQNQHDRGDVPLPVLSAVQLDLLRDIYTERATRRDWTFTSDLSELASLSCVRLTDISNGMCHVDLLPLGRRVLGVR